MRKVFVLVFSAIVCQSCFLASIVTTTPPAQPVQQTKVVYSQPVTTVVNTNHNRTQTTTVVEVTPLTRDICLYLDLRAVGAAFAQSRSVQDFEHILNSNAYLMSNLDLNRDGYIDYLRVLEMRQGYNHVLLIQAVLGANYYQDVATIVAEMSYNTPYVQVIGAPYIYGANYIIEPVFYNRPPMFDAWGRSSYATWRSPYYWDYYPSYYNRHAPYELSHYQAYVKTYMQHHRYCQETHYANQYHYANYKNIYQHESRNDYAAAHPEQSFSRRAESLAKDALRASGGVTLSNARALQEEVARSATRTTTTTTTKASASTAKPAASTTTKPASSTTSKQASSSTSKPVSVTAGTRTQTTQPQTQSRPSTPKAEPVTTIKPVMTTSKVRSSGAASTTRSSTPMRTTPTGTATSTQQNAPTTSTSTGTRTSVSAGTRR